MSDFLSAKQDDSLQVGNDESKLPAPYYDKDGITIFCADCREILPHLPKGDEPLPRHRSLP